MIGSHSLSALVNGKLNTSCGHGTDSCTRHSARSHCNNECECVTSRRSPHGASGRKSSCASAGGCARTHHSGWRANHGRRRTTVNRTWLHWPWCRIARPCHWHGNTAHAWCRCRNSLRGVHRRNGSAARLSRRAAPSFGLRPNLIPLANPSGPRVVAMPLPLGEQNHTGQGAHPGKQHLASPMVSRLLQWLHWHPDLSPNCHASLALLRPSHQPW